ncbi:trehalose 6-phosphate synthase/phosphatase [Cnuella takakiae]|uniref:Trehalose 6-phosphate synthase/phosphatase n=1 Tax=Cnuella takakiae TaxID=1302690 RepID=A0A1M4V9J8_9BACT|nr:bifunctional alpha,alpha-trehalose-phosphate synthase (UDP-forming)/trehalose-phosphatase [Cnuella takakiae]OLY92665.1 bifunctional alpha,alpha-trehalose-phosphate synthase (UDP-forming)/trehalose-phosphatase [Cnuella takakiae]SHE65560.1 trehalose 6-phosphate synthase/phosphatase [Cnuella takakiae]
MSRLIIVSNRLPFSIDRSNDTLSVRQSSGGLVSAIKSYFEGENQTADFQGKIWIGTFDAPEEDWQAALEAGAIPTDFGIEPVFAGRDIYEAFYNGFSNSTLWPLFHYFPSLVEYEQENFDAYLAVNRLFAEKIQAIYQPGDVVWVHDYQLLLLPALVRQLIPDITLGFFLHIPFPSYEIFRMMPTDWKRQILHGMLGADLIGFHTHDYVQHFIQSVKMALKGDSQFNTIYYESRIVRAELFPIAIDFKKFQQAVTTPQVQGIRESLEERFRDKKIIFSVDRLDYTKGLNYRLNAFERFLETYPEWKEKLVFIFNVIPSRDVIPTYIDRKRSIEEKVSTINGRFSTLDWQPLLYRYNHMSFEELCALYSAADVALITPLRDGMNLVAKEYVAACSDKGVLILSELTGAASELSEALQVNPTDIMDVVQALEQALLMPANEQGRRLAGMQQRLSRYDVNHWIEDFLQQLQEAKQEQQRNEINLLDPDEVKEILEAFHKAEKRCILLDYDGTLSPIQKLPSMAKPSEELLELLIQLCSDPRNEVVVISGRDADTLEGWLGQLPLSLVAEHGACIRLRNESWQTLSNQSPSWKEAIKPILELFVNRCPGSFIEEKKNTLAWHYRTTNPDLGFTRSRELRNSLLQLTTNTNLQVIDGNKVIEVRQIGIDKGNTACNIINQFAPDFVLCMGDDTTDEDMFKTLRDQAFTIKIGRGTTAAQYSLWSQEEVLPLLRKLINHQPKVYG